MIRAAVEDFPRLVAEGLARGGALAVSGGSTPAPFFSRLAAHREVPWHAVELFQVDERLAPDGHPDRNWGDVEALLAEPAGIPRDRRHPMPAGEDAPPAALARAYAAALPGRLDVVHLGLGDDGHTASLAPGWGVPGDADVAATPVYRGRRRLTLTPRALNRARRIVWLVVGEGKRAALEQMLAGSPATPAAAIRRDGDVWLCTDLW